MTNLIITITVLYLLDLKILKGNIISQPKGNGAGIFPDFFNNFPQPMPEPNLHSQFPFGPVNPNFYPKGIPDNFEMSEFPDIKNIPSRANEFYRPNFNTGSGSGLRKEPMGYGKTIFGGFTGNNINSIPNNFVNGGGGYGSVLNAGYGQTKSNIFNPKIAEQNQNHEMINYVPHIQKTSDYQPMSFKTSVPDINNEVKYSSKNFQEMNNPKNDVSFSSNNYKNVDTVLTPISSPNDYHEEKVDKMPNLQPMFTPEQTQNNINYQSPIRSDSNYHKPIFHSQPNIHTMSLSQQLPSNYNGYSDSKNNLKSSTLNINKNVYDQTPVNGDYQNIPEINDIQNVPTSSFPKSSMTAKSYTSKNNVNNEKENKNVYNRNLDLPNKIQTPVQNSELQNFPNNDDDKGYASSSKISCNQDNELELPTTETPLPCHTEYQPLSKVDLNEQRSARTENFMPFTSILFHGSDNLYNGQTGLYENGREIHNNNIPMKETQNQAYSDPKDFNNYYNNRVKIGFHNNIPENPSAPYISQQRSNPLSAKSFPNSFLDKSHNIRDQSTFTNYFQNNKYDNNRQNTNSKTYENIENQYNTNSEQTTPLLKINRPIQNQYNNKYTNTANNMNVVPKSVDPTIIHNPSVKTQQNNYFYNTFRNNNPQATTGYKEQNKNEIPAKRYQTYNTISAADYETQKQGINSFDPNLNNNVGDYTSKSNVKKSDDFYDDGQTLGTPVESSNTFRQKYPSNVFIQNNQPPTTLPVENMHQPSYGHNAILSPSKSKDFQNINTKSDSYQDPGKTNQYGSVSTYEHNAISSPSKSKDFQNINTKSDYYQDPGKSNQYGTVSTYEHNAISSPSKSRDFQNMNTKSDSYQDSGKNNQYGTMSAYEHNAISSPSKSRDFQNMNTKSDYYQDPGKINQYGTVSADISNIQIKNNAETNTKMTDTIHNQNGQQDYDYYSNQEEFNNNYGYNKDNYGHVEDVLQLEPVATKENAKHDIGKKEGQINNHLNTHSYDTTKNKVKHELQQNHDDYIQPDTGYSFYYMYDDFPTTFDNQNTYTVEQAQMENKGSQSGSYGKIH